MSLEEYRQYLQPARANGDYYPNLGLYGDGYDQMERLGQASWSPVSSWGRDGWDLGDWPYVIVYARVYKNAPQVLIVTEGDNDLWEFPDKQTQSSFIDEWAQWWWENHSNGPSEDTPAEDRKGPYRSKENA
jgi:hypothetical protein